MRTMQFAHGYAHVRHTNSGRVPMSSTTLASPLAGRSTVGPMIIIGVLFFIFGFVTWLNGPLITFVKLAFNLDDVNAFLVPFAFYISYLVFSLPVLGACCDAPA